MIDEQEVLITPDGLGRAAIVKGPDGRLCIYVHWIWDEETKVTFNVAPVDRTTWICDQTPLDKLYEDLEPESGIYGTMDDARRAISVLRGFSDAKPTRMAD